eukprot:Skav233064  [mRNA]  locus=scaffold1468:15846:18038:- [translate_table: standard]
MEGFDGTPEEKKAVSDLLTEMGYNVEGGGSCCQPAGTFQVQKDVKELGLDAFMDAVPKGTAVRTRANLSRFLKTLAEEPDFAPADLTDAVATAPTQPKEEPGFLSWFTSKSSKESADDPSPEKFHVLLHNIVKAGEDNRKLTIRVIHLSRFVEYTLESRRHARLVLPEGASLQLMCELSDGVRFHRSCSAKDLVEKGSMVLAHSWHQGSDQGFLAMVKPPLAPPPQPTSSVYHFCGPDPETERGVLKVWYMQPGEVKSEATLTKLERYQSMAVLPVASGSIFSSDRGQLHMESYFRKTEHLGKNRFRIKECADDKQIPTSQHAGRHVYISQFQENLSVDAGALVNEPKEFDASADLADDAADDAVYNGFRIHLHNISAEKEKFGVTLPDDRVADFQLDNHCHSALRLPEGSSIEVESQSAEFPESKASITLGPKDLVNGANVYLFSECKASRSSILWHFCTLGAETLWLQAKTPSKEPGVALTSGESRAVTASDSVLTVWDNQPDASSGKCKLREKIIELDTRKFVNRHVYVVWDSRKSSQNFTDGFLGALPGAKPLSDSADWDALQA